MIADQEPTPHLRLELISQARYLCCVREMTMAAMTRIGFDSLESSKIALAVDEALANIICHGYNRAPSGRIWLSIAPLPGRAPDQPAGVRIVIEDEAAQVDPEGIRGRDLDKVRPGGLGVHIIREVMDSAEYAKRDGKGMRLILEKRLDAPPAGGRSHE